MAVVMVSVCAIIISNVIVALYSQLRAFQVA